MRRISVSGVRCSGIQACVRADLWLPRVACLVDDKHLEMPPAVPRAPTTSHAKDSGAQTTHDAHWTVNAGLAVEKC
eukprot:3706404-Rhodomonas_salina.1